MARSLSHVVILGLLRLGSTDGSVTTSVSIRGARTAQSAQPADSEDGREQSLQFVQGYRRFPGTNCWHDPGLGSNYVQGAASAVDVGYVGKVSAQVCADHCNANPRCEGFVIMPSEQQCWMRGFIDMGMCKFETKHFDLYVTEKQPLEPADLAESSSEHWPAGPSSVPDYKYLPEVNCYKDFGAVDLSYAGPVASANFCADFCSRDPLCAGFVVMPSQGKCWTKAKFDFPLCDSRGPGSQLFSTYVKNSHLLPEGAPCSQACASGDGYQICCAGQYFCQPNQGGHGEVLNESMSSGLSTAKVMVGPALAHKLGSPVVTLGPE